jgi:hypothetical protein
VRPLPSRSSQIAARADDVPQPNHGIHARTSILNFLFPSVTDLIFIALLLMLTTATLAVKLLGDAGIGWHIRAGQVMLASHSILRTDIFSSTMAGHPWYAWEWLYDLVVAAIHSRTGLGGVVFFTALIIAFTFSLLFRLSLKRGSSIAIAIVFVVLSMFASSIHFFTRPHVVSWLLTLVWFEILDRAEADRRDARRLWLLPVIMFVWVNVHGGFLLGFALLAIYLAGGIVGYFRSTDNDARRGAFAWLRRLSGVTFASAAATFVNPYGHRLHEHIYRYLSDRFLMNHIDEFRSPNFHGLPQQGFVVLLLLTLAALASRTRNLRISHILVIVFAAYAGLYASRNLPTSCILLSLVIAPVLSDTLRELAQKPVAQWLQRLAKRWNSFDLRMTGMEFRLRGHLWPALLVLAGMVASLHGTSWLAPSAHFDRNRFPVQAVDFMAQSGIQEPVFAPDYWGGYLIYRLYPKTKVVLDDRHDLYGDQLLKDYLRVINIQERWQSVLERQRVNVVLMPAGSSLANLLSISPGWRMAYSDSVAVLFQRTNKILQ